MASGTMIADYAAFDLDFPDANYPLPDRINGREVLRFGSAATQTAYTRPRFMAWAISGNYSITVRLCWKAASDPDDYLDPVRWRIALERYDPDSALDSEGFGTEKTVADTTFAKTIVMMEEIERPHRPRYTDIVFTKAEADSIEPGDMFRVRITREFFAGTLGIDAELLGVLVFQT